MKNWIWNALAIVIMTALLVDAYLKGDKFWITIFLVGIVLNTLVLWKNHA